VPVVSSVSASSIYINLVWTLSTNNNLAVDQYQIQIQNNAASTFFDMLDYCDGTTALVVSTLSCSIPMTAFWVSPLILVYNDPVVVQVRAHNERGWSTYSAAFGAGTPIIQTVPETMPDIVSGAATTNAQIELTWTPQTLAQSHGSAVISYNIYWDQGLGVYQELIGESSDYLGSPSYIISILTQGISYSFKIRSKNEWGWGQFSTPVSILAALAPA
jgi:hypothetical protein